jgi:hypothetical protein
MFAASHCHAIPAPCERATSSVSDGENICDIPQVSPKPGVALGPSSRILAGSPNNRGSMSEAVTAYAYRVGEAAAPYILDAGLMRLAGIALIIAGFWMLIVMAMMGDH